MVVDLQQLDPTAVVLFNELLQKCQAQGYEMVPFDGLRTLKEQAKLWRQSRPTKEVTEKIRKLRAADCGFLADIIEKVGPCHGRWATNAIPGLSWHNWGEAMDCMRIIKGRAEWEDLNAYMPYGTIAKQMGLRWGGDFTKPDAVHVQINQKELTSLYSIKYINDYFREKQ